MDMSNTIAPKSDQLNADDLISGPRTVTITRVSGNEGNAEQPVNVFFEGDNGKPFRPCKSMRRVMVAIWGADAVQYVGKAMTLYRDPAVKFGGMAVGGIRISHMSGLSEPRQMALTASRAKRAPYTVKPLSAPQSTAPTEDKARGFADRFIAAVNNAADPAALDKILSQGAGNLEKLKGKRDELVAECEAAVAAKRAKLTGDASDDLGDDLDLEDAA